MGNIYVFAIKITENPILLISRLRLLFRLLCEWHAPAMIGTKCTATKHSDTHSANCPREIWFHLVAWDEEKEEEICSGGDQGQGCMEHPINADAQNPTLIESEERNLSAECAKSIVISPKTWTHWMCSFMRDLRAIASSWISALVSMIAATTI